MLEICGVSNVRSVLGMGVVSVSMEVRLARGRIGEDASKAAPPPAVDPNATPAVPCVRSSDVNDTSELPACCTAAGSTVSMEMVS